MKRNPVNLLMLCTATVLLTFTACKKEAAPDQNNQSETTTLSDDQAQFSSEVDAVTDDANVIIEESSAFFRTTSTICDASVTRDTVGDMKRLTINYSNSTCAGRNRTRSGSVILSMPVAARWSDAGAMLTVTFQDFKVTRVSDSKSMTLNGHTMITNVTGGRIATLANSGAMRHTINSDNMIVKFADGTTRTWNIAKQRDFSYDGGIVISISGTHTDGNLTGISEWGVNRANQHFSTVISQPLVIRQTCSFRVTSGKVEYNTNIKLAITFGLDMHGVPTDCPGSGNYYFKAEYTDLRAITHTLIWPY